MKGDFKMEKAILIKSFVNAFDILPLDVDNLSKFYVDTSEARGDDTAYRLMFLLEESSRKNKKFLFGGHTGCGKSTVLSKIADELESKYMIVKFSIGQYMDFLSVSYFDVILSILRNIVDTAKDNSIKIDKKIIDSIFTYWNEEKVIVNTNTESTDSSIDNSVGGSLLGILSSKIKLYLQSSSEIKAESVIKLGPTVPKFIELVNMFLDDFNKKIDKPLLVIIDDLDKLSIQQARQLFIDNCTSITSLHVNIIYTFPIYLCYSPEFRCIQYEFEDPIILSMIKVKNKDGSLFDVGIETIKDIIFKRADKRLFENGVVDYVIEKSGGCIRTAFKIIRDAAINAELEYKKISNVDETQKIIKINNVQKSYKAYKSGMERMIRIDYLNLLKDIYLTKRPFIDENNIIVMNLLMSLAVIEYNGDRWCDLNPAIKDYLVEMGEINE